MSEREAQIFRDIDRLMVGDKADIDRYQVMELEDYVKPAESWHTELIDQMFGESKVTGDMLPWSSVQDTIRFRPGELTIWGGVKKHGKSLLLNQVILGFIQQGSKAVIASLELHPTETLKRMACQAAAVNEATIAEKAVSEFIDFVQGRMWLYTEVGDMKPQRVIALCRYARAELGVEHIVIDSLMKCGTDEGDYATEKRTINSLQNIAKQTGLHIHLVAHARKINDQNRMITSDDILGTGHITNMADNILLVARNKPKEREARKSNPDESKLDKPDTYLICEGQRHGNGWEGIIGLWFNNSGQFTTKGGHLRPMFQA